MSMTREDCIEHLEKLTYLAINCPDKDRADDAVRSIAMMVLLKLPEENPQYPFPIVSDLEGAMLKVTKALDGELPPDMRN